MAEGELLGHRIKTPAKAKTPLEFWTFGVQRARIRSEQPALELFPAGETPEVPQKGRVVLFARESGADTGKYQLCVMGWGGSVQILFTEP